MRIYDKNIVENKVALFSIFISLRDTYLKVKTLNHMNFLDQIPPKKLNECTRIDFLKAYVFLKNQCINSVPRNINHVSKNVFIIIEGLKEFNQEFSLDLNHIDYKDKLLSLIEEKEDYRYIGLASIIRQILSNKYTIEEKKWLQKLENITEESVVPFYQPIIKNNLNNSDSHKYEIIKHEALIRYYDIETGKYHEPGEFLYLIKCPKLQRKITKMMVRKVIKKMSESDSSQFSINITEFDLENNEVMNFILKELKENNIDHKRLTVEIVEEVQTKNKQITKTIKKIKSTGIKISIDDYGTDNSHLQRFFDTDADFIKIDGSLIKNILTNFDNQEVIKTLVNIVSRNSAEIIAEYVEDEEKLRYLESVGVNFSQGYHFGKPQIELHTNFDINKNIKNAK